MLFKKPNIDNEIDSLEYAQKLLDDRLKQKQIDSKVYTEKSLKIREKLEKLKTEKIKREYK